MRTVRIVDGVRTVAAQITQDSALSTKDRHAA